MEQGSNEWKQLRLGKVTASRVSDMTARTKTGYGTSRANYMAELIAERLTGFPSDRYTNAAMAWGSETEDEARASYEFRGGVVVETVAFVHHPSIPNSGASPDGMVGTDGLVEIKCPNTSTHLDTLLGQRVPGKYITQIQWQLACTGRAWTDFVSYDPRLPGQMQMYVERLMRDDTMISELEAEVVKFLAELDAKLEALDKIYGQREAA